MHMSVRANYLVHCDAQKMEKIIKRHIVASNTKCQ